MNTRRRKHVDLLIYNVYRDGHRRDYFRVLRRVLGGTAIWGPLAKRWPLLLAARKLVCSTCDDYMPGFFLLAVARSLLGRTTVGLSIRSETIFQRTGFVQLAKRAMLRVLKWWPGVRVLTFMPYWAEPRLARYTTDWMYDLQYWDLPWLDPPPVTSLAGIDDELRRAAAGRLLVTSVGHQRRVKGVEYFMSVFEEESVSSRFLFVCIGPNWDVDKAKVERFRQAGGVFLDRQLRDDEILPVYAMADLVWVCYRPDYDQSSGIFGRAIQLDRPTIVREASYLAVVQAGLSRRGMTIPYGNATRAAAVLAGGMYDDRQPQTRVGPDRTTDVLERCLGVAVRPRRGSGVAPITAGAAEGR